MLEPGNGEQNYADSSEKDTCDQANRGERRQIVSTLVAHEGPRCCIEHQPTESAGSCEFQTAGLGRKFSGQVRQRLPPRGHGGCAGFVVGRF
jgi:hypothetical protein